MNSENLSYKDRFNVTGFFYLKGKLRFRKMLDITKKDTKKCDVDLIVVMMNPGSSKQMRDFQEIYDRPVPAIHDPTQAHIMYLMEKWGRNHARVLNLSDYCTEDSKELYRFLKNHGKKDPTHSIFHPDRETDLKKYFVSGVPIIAGWGVNNSLRELACTAKDYLKSCYVVGLEHKMKPWGFYHPQTRPKYLQNKIWRESLLHQYPSLNL